jgi:hypothetical protein
MQFLSSGHYIDVHRKTDHTRMQDSSGRDIHTTFYQSLQLVRILLTPVFKRQTHTCSLLVSRRKNKALFESWYGKFNPFPKLCYKMSYRWQPKKFSWAITLRKYIWEIPVGISAGTPTSVTKFSLLTSHHSVAIPPSFTENFQVLISTSSTSDRQGSWTFLTRSHLIHPQIYSKVFTACVITN